MRLGPVDVIGPDITARKALVVADERLAVWIDERGEARQAIDLEVTEIQTLGNRYMVITNAGVFTIRKSGG